MWRSLNIEAMLHHIVFFKLNKQLAERDEKLAVMQQMLLALKDKIDVIQELECGRNFSTRDSAYDLALVVKLADEDALEAYRVHPEHQKVLGYIKEIKPQTAVVDYFV